MGSDANIGLEKVRYALSFYFFPGLPVDLASFVSSLSFTFLAFFLVYTFRRFSTHRTIPCFNSFIFSLFSYLQYSIHPLRTSHEYNTPYSLSACIPPCTMSFDSP